MQDTGIPLPWFRMKNFIAASVSIATAVWATKCIKTLHLPALAELGSHACELASKLPVFISEALATRKYMTTVHGPSHFDPALQLWPAVQSKRQVEFFHRERFDAEVQLSLTCPRTGFCCERHKHIIPSGRGFQTAKTVQARIFQPFPEQRGDEVLQDTDGQEVQACEYSDSTVYSKDRI